MFIVVMYLCARAQTSKNPTVSVGVTNYLFGHGRRDYFVNLPLRNTFWDTAIVNINSSKRCTIRERKNCFNNAYVDSASSIKYKCASQNSQCKHKTDIVYNQ